MCEIILHCFNPHIDLFATQKEWNNQHKLHLVIPCARISTFADT